MLEHSPYIAVYSCPDHDAPEPDGPERAPGRWYTEGGLAPGEGGEAVGAVEGAEEGFSAGFYECGERDGELSHAQPACAAIPVAC